MSKEMPELPSVGDATVSTASIPHTIPPKEAPQIDAFVDNKSFIDHVPTEYREKGYMSKIQDMDSLFKAFDNAQSLIGKRPAGIPQENASKEDWDKFYSQLGRPDNVEGYDIKLPEELPKGLEIPEGNLNQFKDLAHEIGLNPEQAQKIIDLDLKLKGESLKNSEGSYEETQAKLDSEFEEMVKKAFGDRRDEVIDNSKNLIAKYATSELGEMVQDLDNKSIMVLSAILDGVTKDYIGEDSITPRNVGNQTPSTREKAIELMKSPAFRDPFDPAHDDVQRQVREIYSSLQ
jgi:hypothetical protein